jgi:hypothetical protein
MPSYPYSRISIPFSKTFLKFKNAPLLKVGILVDSGAMVKPLAYIDTGAQICIFDNSYAKQLGIKDYKATKTPEDIISLSGIGGRKPENRAYFHDLKLVIFKDQTHLRLDNKLQIIETKIGFLEASIEFAGILGVYGFLDQFSFKANIPEGYFELEPLF